MKTEFDGRPLRLVFLAKILSCCGAIFLCIPVVNAQPTRQEVVDSMHRSVDFFREHASAGGGYIFQLSANLKKREGEGVVGPTTAWMEPPATPSVGRAYLIAYQLCGDQTLLAAAKEAAHALVRGQLESGGWDTKIEFDLKDRKGYAYRVDTEVLKNKKVRNTTTFDDDKSQSAITFLMRLDQALGFEDEAVHEATQYALDSSLKAQYPNGAWPQKFDGTAQPSKSKVQRASLPETWSREFPAKKYSNYYTLNDSTINDLIAMMLDAWEIYDDPRYLQSALRGGDFLLLAQLPEPQPGWAQQYDQDMHPAWARKFEPPAITGGESQGVMQTLMMLYRRTAEHKNSERFLQPIEPAIAYFRRSLLSDGRLARFYELKTNRPLFFTTTYQLTYSSDDMPTHYGFIVGSKLDRLEKELNRCRNTPIDELWKPRKIKPAKSSEGLDKRVTDIIRQLDERGAWVEPGRLRYHGEDDPTDRVIRSQTFIGNLNTFAQWLSANPA
ncbi:MAG: pectate lyase [Rubripirellula sp.]